MIELILLALLTTTGIVWILLELKWKADNRRRDEAFLKRLKELVEKTK